MRSVGRWIVIGAVVALARVVAAQPAVPPDAALPPVDARLAAPDASTPSPGVDARAGDPDAAPGTIDAPFVLGQPEVSASASPATVRLGEPFTLYVVATYGEDVTVNLPASLGLGDALEEAPGRTHVDRRRPGGRRTREWQVPMRAWQLGKLSLPPVNVTFVSPGGSGVVPTAPIALEVVGIVADADDPNALRGLAPPRPLDRRDWTLVIIASVVLGVAIAAWLVVRTLRRRRRRVRRMSGLHQAVPWRAVRSLDGPTAEALRALAAIQAAGTPIDAPDQAVAEVVATLRTYAGRRGGFVADDLTSSELARALERRDLLAPPQRAELARLLSLGDRVKYAGVPADGAEAQGALQAARALVLTEAGGALEDAGG